MSEENFINQQKNKIEKIENKFDLVYQPTYEYDKQKKSDYKFEKKPYYAPEKQYSKEYEGEKNKKYRDVDE